MNRGKLSPRELEALTWAAKGKTYWETSKIIGVSYPSVHNYIGSLKLKLNATNVTHAVALGYELGILELRTAEPADHDGGHAGGLSCGPAVGAPRLINGRQYSVDKANLQYP
jgi:DNA-binding CsgD family transcriptional regulator